MTTLTYTLPNALLDEGCEGMRFILNDTKFKILCRLRGWKHPPSDLARATGYSRSYCLKVLKGKEKVTDLFMLKIIKVAGCDTNNVLDWASFFIPVCCRCKNLSCKYNMEKFYGRMPYEWGSSCYQLRKNDGDYEEKSFKSFLDKC